MAAKYRSHVFCILIIMFLSETVFSFAWGLHARWEKRIGEEDNMVDACQDHFPPLFRVKPAGTWSPLTACDWLRMWWNDGVRILKGLLWLAGVDCTHLIVHNHACACAQERTLKWTWNVFGCAHMGSCMRVHKTKFRIWMHTQEHTMCLTKPPEIGIETKWKERCGETKWIVLALSSLLMRLWGMLIIRTGAFGCFSDGNVAIHYPAEAEWSPATSPSCTTCEWVDDISSAQLRQRQWK